MLADVLSRRRAEALTVVFETAVTGYVSREGRQQVHAAIAEAGADGGVAFVRSGRPDDGSDMHWALWVELWPDDAEPRAVAHAHFHGAWIEWLA